MKKVFCLLFFGLLVASCSPSPEDIQKAIEQTNEAFPTHTIEPSETIEPTKTNTPTITLTSTPKLSELVAMTLTATNAMPETTTYIFEAGFCIMSVNVEDIDGIPNDEPGCVLSMREQIELEWGYGEHYWVENFEGDVQLFCSLYELDGTYIVTEFDTNGTGEVVCFP